MGTVVQINAPMCGNYMGKGYLFGYIDCPVRNNQINRRML